MSCQYVKIQHLTNNDERVAYMRAKYTMSLLCDGTKPLVLLIHYSVYITVYYFHVVKAIYLLRNPCFISFFG
jgi:hypothetical protein